MELRSQSVVRRRRKAQAKSVTGVLGADLNRASRRARSDNIHGDPYRADVAATAGPRAASVSGRLADNRRWSQWEGQTASFSYATEQGLLQVLTSVLLLPDTTDRLPGYRFGVVLKRLGYGEHDGGITTEPPRPKGGVE
jgi:hypothetical protein